MRRDGRRRGVPMRNVGSPYSLPTKRQPPTQGRKPRNTDSRRNGDNVKEISSVRKERLNGRRMPGGPWKEKEEESCEGCA